VSPLSLLVELRLIIACSHDYGILETLFETVRLPRVIACQDCGYRKARTQWAPPGEIRFSPTVRVNLPSTTEPSMLMDCLVASLYTEPGKGANRIPCPICGKNSVPIHRFYKFRTLPEVLLVSITRTMANAAGDYMKNRAQCVVTQILDLSVYLEDEDITRDQNAAYQLAGAVLHTGPTIDSGHYVVHVRNKAGNYFRLDDVASPRVTQSSIHRLNNDIGFDVVLVAYVKVHKDDSKEQDAAMRQMMQDYLRDRTVVTTEGGELYPAGSDTIKLTDEPPAPAATLKQEYPKREPLTLDLLKPDPPVRDPPKPDYSSMDEKQLKSLMKRLGLKLDNKKHPPGWYIDILVRHDANVTTYDEYTVDQLIKGEIIRRGLNPKGIKTRAAATKELERDDKEKGFKRPSMCSIIQALQTNDKPRNSEGGPQKPDKKKRGRPPGRKAPIEKPPKKPPKKLTRKLLSRSLPKGPKTKTFPSKAGRIRRT
jgi:hypothetical protein